MPLLEFFSRGGGAWKDTMDADCAKVIFTVKEEAQWVPIYTQPLHELRLHKFFTERGIINYLPVIPLVKTQTVNAGDKKYNYKRQVLRPMFSSYIFAQMSREQKNASWASKSIIRILDVPQEQQQNFVEELRGIWMMEKLSQSRTIEFREDINVKDRFLIESGVFEGTYGWLVQKKKKFLWVVKIECMGTYVTTEMDPTCFKITKIEK